MSERQLRQAIKENVKMFGGAVYDTEQERANTRVTAGIPDLMVFYRGRFTFVELKFPRTPLEKEDPTWMLRASQRQFKAECELSDTPWALWTCIKDALDWMGIEAH